MISKDLVEKIILENINDEYFIVNITVSKSNVIEVLLDGDNGVTIQKCIDVSRAIEQSFDRDQEDFELNVSSSGLGRSFKVYRQYLKNIGKMVEVNVLDRKPVSGILKTVDGKGFEIETTSKESIDGKKKKVEVVKIHRFEFEASPKVRNIISFK